MHTQLIQHVLYIGIYNQFEYNIMVLCMKYNNLANYCIIIC